MRNCAALLEDIHLWLPSAPTEILPLLGRQAMGNGLPSATARFPGWLYIVFFDFPLKFLYMIWNFCIFYQFLHGTA